MEKRKKKRKLVYYFDLSANLPGNRRNIVFKFWQSRFFWKRLWLNISCLERTGRHGRHLWRKDELSKHEQVLCPCYCFFPCSKYYPFPSCFKPFFSNRQMFHYHFPRLFRCNSGPYKKTPMK